MHDPIQGKHILRRRLWRGVLMAIAIGTIGVLVWLGPAMWGLVRYEPREGDILFQSLPMSPVVAMIEGGSGSAYSHCGIVERQEGKWVVWEALGEVRQTPLAQFLPRGRRQGYAVYRFRKEWQEHVPMLLRAVADMRGRPYDHRYRWDDEQIYCSELIYKAYAALRPTEPLGRLVKVRDLHWQPFAEVIKHLEDGGEVPLDRELITPRDLAGAPQLQLVDHYRIDPWPSAKGR